MNWSMSVHIMIQKIQDSWYFWIWTFLNIFAPKACAWIFLWYDQRKRFKNGELEDQSIENDKILDWPVRFQRLCKNFLNDKTAN